MAEAPGLAAGAVDLGDPVPTPAVRVLTPSRQHDRASQLPCNGYCDAVQAQASACTPARALLQGLRLLQLPALHLRLAGAQRWAAARSQPESAIGRTSGMHSMPHP